MTAAKYTPGPWKPPEPSSNFQKGKILIKPVDHNGSGLPKTIAEIPATNHPWREKEANARLIATAPKASKKRCLCLRRIQAEMLVI